MGDKEYLTIEDFLQKYGTPYDPENDSYEVPPFQENIDDASKSSAIYNMHMYWTKQDPYVVRRYIEHYTKPGDLVLDAFAGTGMTGVAALMSGRHAILCDISPACVHIAKNYTTPIDPRLLEDAWRKIRQAIEPEIRPLYKTTCHRCDNPDAQIANIILSDVLRCPRCSAEVLYAGDGRWERMKKGEKINKIRCHNCNVEFTKAKAKFVRVEPVEIRVNCNVCKVKGDVKSKPLDEKDWELYISIEGGPTRIVHEGDDKWSGYRFEPVSGFLNELGTKVYKKTLSKQTVDYIQPKEVPYWYPKDVSFFGKEPMRNLKRGITHPYQMYSRRNLIVLSILWHYIHENKSRPSFGLTSENPILGVEDDFIFSQEVRAKLRFAFTGILYYCSLMNREKKEREKPTPRRGTLYISSFVCNLNIVETLHAKIKTINRNISKIKQQNFSQVYISLNDAQKLSLFPQHLIDYAFYDPPYGGNINYSELNIMWEAWLPQQTDTRNEIIENPAQQKDRKAYGDMMEAAFKEAFHVLKPGRWLSLVYSYSDPSMYRLIQKSAHEAGFLDEGQLLHINSKSKTQVQQESDKAQQRFLIINFKKPQNGERKTLEKAENIELQVIQVVQDYLTKYPGKTRDQMYDEAIKRLFTTVKIENFNLDEILKNFFRKVGDEWFAPGTLITRKKDDKEKLGLFDELEHPEREVMLKLQEFLKKYGTVPYSELREFYLRKLNVENSRDFDEIVNDNFIVEKGKVRLPTLEEQLKMQDVTIRYRKRIIKSFLEGNLNRQPETQEICDWIVFCYENRLYREGYKLFELVDESSISSDTYQKIKKIADACKVKLED